MIKLFKKIKNSPVSSAILIALPLLLVPISVFAADLWDPVIGVFKSIPAMIVLVGLAFILLLAVTFSSICGALLNFVISPSFINVSYTSPTEVGELQGNKIIEIGLSITKDFVNLALVIILIYIAFAIALRIGDLNAKKLLVRLIAIALLVNFAPVVVGLIVDASNIVMNFFLEDIGSSYSSMLSMFHGSSHSLSNNLSSLFTLSGQTSYIAQAIALIVFNYAVGVALFLFAGIFIVRYVVIWVLVILSPLAFVAWILPATKKYWDMWWENLIQWSVIGIPIAFFLYLSARSLDYLPSAMSIEMSGVGVEPSTSGLLNETFPYFVVLIFLFLGFSIGLSTSAMGATSVIKATKKTGNWTKAKAGAGARKLTAKAIGKDRAQRQASAQFIPERVRNKGTLAKIGYGATVAAPIWAVRRGLGEIGLRETESSIKEINEAKEKNKGKSPERVLTSIRDSVKTGKTNSAVGALSQAISDGKLKELGKLGLDEKEVTKIGRAAAKTHPEMFKGIRDAFPTLAESMVAGLSKDLKKKVGLEDLTQQEIDDGISMPMRIATKIKPDSVSKINEKDLEHTEVQKALHSMSPAQISSFLEKGPFKAKDIFIDTVKVNGLSHYKTYNPALANYFKSNPGIRALGGELQEEEEEEPRIIRP